MKKFLPTILFGMVFLLCLFTGDIAFAQSPSPTVAAQDSTTNQGTWIEDPEVTFVGKLAARSDMFLNSVIKNYQWYHLNTDTSRNSLASFWVNVRNIVYAFFALLVLVTAFVIIINRGRNMTFLKFIPRFIAIIILVTFSFALIQFIYQITDIIQGFFFQLLRDGSGNITSGKIINISFDYKDFVGYRLVGSTNDESTFVSLLLAKLTAITMYLMAGILFVRKIILWFFILISPIFPLLLLYSPIRNTGKIWLGEFLKWLLYGPLFAILLGGVVTVWGNSLFRGVQASESLYPTTTNILLGGPGQAVSLTNSINTPETFVLYIIALIMLWATIILPFVLLQIFLSYFQNLSPDAGVVRQMLNMTSTFLNKPPSSPLPLPPTTTGMAKSLPIPAKAGMAREIERPAQVIRSNSINSTVNRPVTTSNTFNQPITTTNQQFNQVTNSILQTANLRIPTIRDIARLETHAITHNEEVQKESSRVATILSGISNPHTAETPVQRDQFRGVREQLIQEKQKGNPVATTILQAASATSESIKEGAVSAALPAVNRVQSVSLEDYESVKKLWQENYGKMEAPKDMNGTQKDKASWIKEDTQKAQEAINKLQSSDPKMVKEGMNMVSSILPFLLIGGFSQTEIIAYLKAKLEAGNTALSDISKKEEEESTKVDRDEDKKEEQAQMTMSAQVPVEPKEKREDNGKDYNIPV